MTPQKLDTSCTIETPEGIRLELYPAGPVARGAAWLIDSLIRIGLYIGLALVLGVLGATGTGILLVAVFLLEWFYPVYFELRSGST
ncbi:MAG: RDD family protein, partial [Sedimenticolaceae bacterium]|nr:RDD family protein [Sedimenticolaceae bacterium]